jgi:regulator of cell morphogenesis and NO signaling
MNVHETISGFFEQDHDEIDEILASVDFERPAEALPRLKEFDERLERHIVWEESVLFPAAARLAPPLADGPIAVMREEHKLIRRHKLEALDALRAGDGRAAKRGIASMLDVLRDHNMKEERMLYPTCDRVLAGEEADRVLAAVTCGSEA